MSQSLSVEKVRMEARALGDFMRWRYVELSDLPADEQATHLALEIKQWLKDFSVRDQDRILNDAELRFPNCENRCAVISAPPQRPPNANDLSLEELTQALANRLEGVSDEQREAVYDRLGAPKTSPPQMASAAITLEQIVAQLKELGSRSLQNGDPLLRDPSATGASANSVEKEFSEAFAGGFKKKLHETAEVSCEALAQAFASALIELACVESLAFAVLMKLNARVFDPVHGHLVRKQSILWDSLATLLQTGNVDSFVVGLRQYTGLAKSLLFQYAWLADRNGELIAEFSPANIGRNNAGREWDVFKRKYNNVIQRLTDLDPRRLPDSEFIINAVREYVEARVSGTVNEYYNWQLKGTMQ